MELEGRKVLVTGGTRGIGKSISLAFQALGADVVITGRSRPDDVPESKFVSVDFLEPNSVSSFLEFVETHGFDVIVNNAGINKIDLGHQIDYKDWKNIQEVNLNVPFLVCQKAIPHMKKNNWGRIINIASIFGVVSKSKRASYTSSKFGLIGLTKTLSLDYAKDNILVNCVSPGFIDTELTRTILSEEEIEQMVSTVPMGRLGKPEEIANIVTFLGSDMNSFITGQNIVADGGFVNG